MNIINVDVKLNYKRIAKKLIEDANTYDEMLKKAKRSNNTSTVLSALAGVLVAIICFISADDGAIIAPFIFGGMAFAFAYGFTRICTSFSDYCKYNYLYGINAARAKDIYTHVKKTMMKRQPDFDRMNEDEKFKWLREIPFVEDIIKNYGLMIAAQDSKCAINWDIDDCTVKFIDTESFDSCERDIDEYYTVTKRKKLTPQQVALILTEDEVYIYEIGSLQTGIEVKFVNDSEYNFGEAASE